MRILYVWDADYPWDVRTEKICAALTSAGHDVHIAARNRHAQAALAHVPEATVHRMPVVRPAGLNTVSGFPAFVNPRWYRLIQRVIRHVRPDIVMVRDLPLAPLALFVARRNALPVLFDMAENYPAMLRKLWQTGTARPIDNLVRNPSLASIIERAVLPRMDRVIVVIEEAAEYVLELGVERSRLHVVSNTPPRERALRPLPDARPYDVTYLGIMEVDRGLLEVIDAIALLEQRGISVRARLVGSGRDAHIFQEHARSRRLPSGRLEFAGHVPGHDQALDMISRSRIGLVPHRRTEWAETTIPNKLFDYMAAGVPVLSSDSAPCARILAATGAGSTFRAGDAVSLATVLESMLSDAATLSQQGDAGREAVRSRYNWEQDAAELLRAVELTLNAGPVRR